MGAVKKSRTKHVFGRTLAANKEVHRLWEWIYLQVTLTF